MIACKTTLVVSGYASTSESTTNLKSLNSQARMTMLDRIVDLLLKCFPVAERLDVQKAQEGEHLIERWWSAQGLACRKEGVGDL